MVKVRRSILGLLSGLFALVVTGGIEAQQTPPPATVPPAATAPAPAAPPTLPPTLPDDVIEPVNRLARSIESAEKSIAQLKELEGELSRLRTDVERIIYESTATAEQLRPQLAEVRSQIEKIGAPPAKDQPAESATVAAERARLNALAGGLDGAVKTAELAWVRAKQLIDRITVMRYQLFTRNLLERRDSPVLPAIWRDLGPRMDQVASRLRYYGGDWLGWAARKSKELTALFIVAAGVVLLISLATGRFVRRRLKRPEPPPSFFERAMQAAWVAPARMLAPLAGALAVYGGLDGLDLIFAPWDGLAMVALKGVLVLAASWAILATALAPRNPAWRLIPVSNRTARRVLWLLVGFVAVYVLDTILNELGRVLYVPLTVTVVQSFLSSLLFAGLLVALLVSPFEPQIGPDRPVNGHEFVPGPVSRNSPLWLKIPLWLCAAVILIASLLGYIALGRFVAHQLVLSGMVVAIAGLLYLAIRATTRGRTDGRNLLGDVLDTKFGIDAPRRRQLSRLTELMASVLLALLALPVLLVQWGFSSADIRDWSKSLLFGFEIGQFKISLFRILIGIGLFIGLLFLTRLLQRWLRDRATGMDAGIANSVETAVGYAGTALALLIAVSYAGFDVTSLAIVAGALSVGIGFGLQSIVNNFVSGLILLVERPVKVGDWIVVGDQQGNVRRISVRATEIETFDKASLIIPNSELITGRVFNWTHRNVMGRVVVKISVDPNADPEAVMTILKTCAEAHPSALKSAPAAISFDAFSGSSLDYTVRVTVADVTAAGNVGTDLRISILKELRANGMIVPNPQYDIRLKDLEPVKRYLLQALEERRQAEARDSAPIDPAGPRTA